MKKVYKTSPRGSKKPLVAALAAILTVASIVGGVFAWTDFSQSRTNKFHGTYDADVTLHDEFDGQNKDVFVENTGENPVYVRVRLDEFMQVGETQFDAAANIYDKDTWAPHTYNGDTIEDCGHIESTENDTLFHDYYTWTMSGAQRNYKAGAPGMVYTMLGADDKVDTTGSQTTADAAKPILMSVLFDAYDEIAKYDANQAYAAEAGLEPNVPKPDQEIYDLVEAAKNGCWILDNTAPVADGGGWAYWSIAIPPMEIDENGVVTTHATNLLLDEVALKKDAENDWIYRIDVKLQAVSLGDTELWHNEDANAPTGHRLTADARKLIALWNA